MRSATYRELVRGNREFRRLWVGQVISELGTWFSFIAELGLVRLLSGSSHVDHPAAGGTITPVFSW
jgi:hypothetical protein